MPVLRIGLPRKGFSSPPWGTRRRRPGVGRVVLALCVCVLLGGFPSWAGPAELPGVLIGKDGVRLLLVPAGTFRKGSTESEIQSAVRMARRYHPYVRPEWFADERPAREAYLPAFYIDETEVSVARFLWKGGPPPNLSEQFQLPPRMIRGWSVKGEVPSWDIAVANVTWHDALAYCRGVGRRLPTADEWEKAARGTDGRVFPWGNRFESGRLNSYEAGLRGAALVGSHPGGASPYGALDMAGNVWEWVADWYDPPSRREDRRKVIRGGGWGYDGAFARAANLGAVWPGERHPALGFRCAKDP